MHGQLQTDQYRCMGVRYHEYTYVGVQIRHRHAHKPIRTWHYKMNSTHYITYMRSVHIDVDVEWQLYWYTSPIRSVAYWTQSVPLISKTITTQRHLRSLAPGYYDTTSQNCIHLRSRKKHLGVGVDVKAAGESFRTHVPCAKQRETVGLCLTICSQQATVASGRDPPYSTE